MRFEIPSNILEVLSAEDCIRILETAMTTTVKHNIGAKQMPEWIRACGFAADRGFSPACVQRIHLLAKG